jgi:hypothetical protein
MTVYVDELRDYTEIARAKGLPATHWCHLTADTRDELHAFAARLGLRRAWFQDDKVLWHYDLTPGKRVQALRLGATEVTFREIGALITARRWGNAPGPACHTCKIPFDPTDTRHDGAAQYRDTGFCFRCIDRCHESTDFAHRCPVCTRGLT